MGNIVRIVKPPKDEHQHHREQAHWTSCKTSKHRKKKSAKVARTRLETRPPRGLIARAESNWGKKSDDGKKKRNGLGNIDVRYLGASGIRTNGGLTAVGNNL